MKIRNGFISNSSSSSFIILGFKISTEEIKNLYKDSENFLDSWYDEDEFDTLYNDNNNSYYAGHLISYGDDQYESFEIDILKLKDFEKAKIAANKFNKSLNDLKLFGGTILT